MTGRLTSPRRAAALLAAASLLAACTSGSENDPGATGSPPPTSSPTSTAQPTVEPSQDVAGEVLVAGSAAQAEAMAAWAEGTTGEYPELDVRFDPVGTQRGLQTFVAGDVDVAAVDLPLNDTGRLAATRRCEGGYVQVPSRLSSIAVVFNLPDLPSLNVDAETLAGVFNQRIISWDDPVFEAFQPINLPPTPIVAVNHARGSATTLAFTEYLAANAGESWPHQPDTSWPLGGGQRGAGSAGAARVVGDQEGAIGYVDAARVGSLGTMALQAGGEYREFSPDAATTVAEQSSIEQREPGDVTVRLARDVTDAYPVADVSYLVACQSYPDEQTTANVEALLRYVVSEDGQQAGAQASSAAVMPSALREQAEAAIDLVGG